MSAAPLLQVDGLVKHFPVTRGVIIPRTVGRVRAVDDVSFHIARGETLALVGESGCGKSTTGRLVLRLMAPTGGSVRFKGEEIANLDKGSMRRLRRHMQIIFQDPYASLSPRRTVAHTIREPLDVHRIGTPAERRERVERLLDVVGLSHAALDRYRAEPEEARWQAVLDLLRDEVPLLPLQYGAAVLAHSWRVRNFTPSPFGWVPLGEVDVRD